MKTPTLPSPTIIHWFRRDLRTHDNIALTAALALSSQTKRPLIPLYILSQKHINETACGAVRARFILETLQNLRDNLSKFHNATLRVATGDPETLLPELTQSWNANDVFWEHELAPEPRARDGNVTTLLAERRVHVHAYHGFTLYNPDILLRRNAAPRNMTSMFALVDRVGDPSLPTGRTSYTVPDPPLGQEYTTIPTLLELGYDQIPEGWEVFKGGEDAGIKRMENFLARKGGRVAAKFSKPETSPAAISPRDTTVLSPYLALGAVSCRLFHQRLKELEQRFEVAKAPQTRLWGQLMWREHFWLLAYSTKNFHQMKGNVLCRQIHWDDSKQAAERLRRWETATTGFPWIDALMIQLKEEGFVHHLGRHSLACFLTRGDLWVSWEKGAQVFEKYLIDYDYALNAANWMWLSCSAFFVMYYRVYSPVAFAKKWDKDGEFVKHYLPVLRKIPTKWVHEPWKAPLDVQKRAGCVVGKDYPKPMVDHKVMSKENIARMKENYQRGEFGKLGNAEGSDVTSGDDGNVIEFEDSQASSQPRKRRRR